MVEGADDVMDVEGSLGKRVRRGRPSKRQRVHSSSDEEDNSEEERVVDEKDHPDEDIVPYYSVRSRPLIAGRALPSWRSSDEEDNS